MPDIWDLDENAIRTDEYKATATLALLALRRGQMPPLGTPLQRTTTRIAAPSGPTTSTARSIRPRRDEVTCRQVTASRPGPSWTCGCT